MLIRKIYTDPARSGGMAGHNVSYVAEFLSFSVAETEFGILTPPQMNFNKDKIRAI